MSIALSQPPLVSPEDYLAEEAAASQKHEYLSGMVYAMAGATQRHDDLAMNIAAALHTRLRGRPDRPYGSGMLVRVERGSDLRFYYPDVSIICRPAGEEARVQTEPSVIFEVLSESTARIDTGEKRLAYLTIPMLEACVLMDSTQPPGDGLAAHWRNVDTRGFLGGRGSDRICQRRMWAIRRRDLRRRRSLTRAIRRRLCPACGG